MNQELIDAFREVVGPDFTYYESGSIVLHPNPPYSQHENLSFNDLFAFDAPWKFWQRAFPDTEEFKNSEEAWNCFPTLAHTMFFKCMTSSDPDVAILWALNGREK